MSEETVYDRALSAAADAFQAVLDEEFGRAYDGSTEDDLLELVEYRTASEKLKQGAGYRLCTGLVDAYFTCWISEFAHENYGSDDTP